MSEKELLEMAQDQLEIACQNLANQKNKASEAYKVAAFEVESCLMALKAVKAQTLTQPQAFEERYQNILE
jgi:hypothetical protein